MMKVYGLTKMGCRPWGTEDYLSLMFLKEQINQCGLHVLDIFVHSMEIYNYIELRDYLIYKGAIF